MTPTLKRTLYSLAGAALAAAGASVLTGLATLPTLAPYAPYLLAAGTALLGKEHLPQSKPTGAP